MSLAPQRDPVLEIMEKLIDLRHNSHLEKINFILAKNDEEFFDSYWSSSENSTDSD